MTLVIPEGYAAVIHSLQWAGDPEPMAVTYGVANASLGGSASDIATEAATAFADLVVNFRQVLALVSTEVRFQELAPPAPPSVGISSITAVGADTATVCPQNTAFLIHKRTALGGRGGRGRFYLPGVAEADVNNTGQLESGVVAVYQPVLTQFLTDLEASAHIAGMVILHDGLGAFGAVAPPPVTSLVLDPRIATQRRRLRR